MTMRKKRSRPPLRVRVGDAVGGKNVSFHPNSSKANVLCLSGFLFAWQLITYILLPVVPLQPGLEASWTAFLTWAFEHKRQFGTEVIFTYGPWGFLGEPRGSMQIYPWQILGRALLAIGTSLWIALFGISWIRSAPWRWVWAFTIAVLAEPSGLIPFLLFLATMPAESEFEGTRGALMLLAAVTGLAACTKFTTFMLVATLLPFLALRRNLWPCLATSVASFFFFWVLAGQNVLNIPQFVLNSFEVSSGYSSAMVVGTPTDVFWWGILICGLPLLQWIRRGLAPPTLENAGRFAWLAACQFLTFRHGMIRFDSEHLYMAFFITGIPRVVLLTPWPGVISKVKPVIWKIAYVLLLAAIVQEAFTFSRLEITSQIDRLSSLSQRYTAFAREILGPNPPSPPTPAAGASVDVFTTELAYALQWGMPLQNRPVFQSYSAYTNRLAEKNTKFLEGPNAPRTIYFHSGTVDYRYPSMEDSLSWRTLLTHYAPSAVIDKYLVLRRREIPSAYELKPLLTQTLQTNQFVQLPPVSERLVWAEITVRRTLRGRLMDLIYRKDKMTMIVSAGGNLQEFRLLDETSSGGFLLSPLIVSPAAMAEAYQGEPKYAAAQKVTAMAVRRSPEAALGYEPDVQLRLYTLQIQSPPPVPELVLRDMGLSVTP